MAFALSTCAATMVSGHRLFPFDYYGPSCTPARGFSRPPRQTSGTLHTGVGQIAGAASNATTGAAEVTRAAQNLNSGILPNGSSAGLVSKLTAASA